MLRPATLSQKALESGSLKQVAEHGLENPAVEVVVEFNRCVDPHTRLELDLLSVGLGGRDLDG